MQKTPSITRIKKLFISILAIFLIFSMTSCSSIYRLSDIIENTIPNVIAAQIKEEILPSDKVEDTANTQSNSQGEQIDNTTPTTSPSSTNDGIDYAKLINEITTDTIRSCVNITTSEYNRYSNTPSSSSIGSGVIFKREQRTNTYHYYVLTNYHVAELSGNYTVFEYVITDYQGNEYQADTPRFISNTSLKTICKENDLAVLEFQSTAKLNAISMESKDPDVNETLISIGQPKGQQNAITLGKIAGYTEVSIQDEFIPDFKVIAHTAPIDRGNSGGAIINTDLKLIGINFAGSWEDDGTFAYGYSIPIETVKKFLSDYGISL